MSRLKLAALISGSAIALVIVLAALRVGELEDQVESRFRGRLFAVPSRIFSAPLVLYPGLDPARVGLEERLRRLNYHPPSSFALDLETGEYRIGAGEIQIARRPFHFRDSRDPGGLVRIALGPDGTIEQIRDTLGAESPTVQLEPELIAQLHGEVREDRQLVSLEGVPDFLPASILAIEDQRFFEHRGLDPRRIAGAFVANLKAGRVVQGGSTLTQQLVKNFYLTRERSFSRKLREAVMSLLLERNHTKEEILEAYLNEVYMGQRGSVAIHGMGEAAQYYFAKRASDLSLAECALLAAMIKGPNLYSPTKAPETAEKRRNLVLDLLLEQGKVDREQHEVAIATPLGVREYPPESNLAPHFVEYLRKDLQRVYGEEILENEGLQIHTTLDPRAQRAANRALREGLERLERDIPALAREDGPLEAALVAVSPRTGEILALVGGRDFQRSQFDRATQARRQPGSVFKPVVALAALERGRTPAHTLASRLEDTPLQIESGGEPWEPVNYDGEFRGEVSLRQAIESSLNVPVARLGLAIGPERIVATARRLGIESDLRPVPSIALGAFEVSLIEMTRAYAVLAAGGVLPVLRGYADVVDADGQVLERKPLHFERVFEPQEVHLVTSALEGVVDRGTGRGLRGRGFLGPVAGKTGTTNDYRDAWFIGFTPDLLVGVWVGFDDGHGLGVPGSAAALPIFASFVEEVVGPHGSGGFAPPGGIERVSIDPTSGLRSGPACPGEPEIFIEGTAPGVRCDGKAPTAIDRAFDWLRDRM